jgi:hypothetical protein
VIDERLSLALAAHPIDGPPCVTADVFAAMLELSEPDVHVLLAAGELPPLVEVGKSWVWAIEDLRVWLRRHEPLWDESDADEPEWWPREPAWNPDEPLESDVRVHVSEWDAGFGFRRMTRAQLDELTLKCGALFREETERV